MSQVEQAALLRGVIQDRTQPSVSLLHLPVGCCPHLHGGNRSPSTLSTYNFHPTPSSSDSVRWPHIAARYSEKQGL